MGDHPEKRVYHVNDKAQRRWLQAIDDRRAMAVQLAQQPVEAAQAKLAEAERKAQGAIQLAGRKLQGEVVELLEEAHPGAEIPEGARVVYDTDAGTVTVLAPRQAKPKGKNPKESATPPDEPGDAAPGAPGESTPEPGPDNVTPMPKKKRTPRRRKKASK